LKTSFYLTKHLNKQIDLVFNVVLHKIRYKFAFQHCTILEHKYQHIISSSHHIKTLQSLLFH